MRKTVLPWMVCAVGAAAGVPALAWGEAASAPRAGSALVDATMLTGDNFFQEQGSAQTDNSVQITPGGTVTFKSLVRPENTSVHNVAFDDASPKPTVCNQTVQSPETPGAPLDTDGIEPVPQFPWPAGRSEEHTSELQSQANLVCRLPPEKKK